MRECKQLGVRFSLDDFGTGFSSLSFLKRLPADMVKIDRSFIGGMLENRDDMALVEGVIRLASVFGLDVIAEGIETAEHERRLLSMGCEFGQGYAIGRPMPAKDLPGWLAMREPGAAAAAVRSVDSRGAGHNNGMNGG